MKITWDKEAGSPYEAVGQIITDWAERNFYDTFIVWLETSTLGKSVELLEFDLNSDGLLVWDNDWYEGGDVELIGFCPLSMLKPAGLTQMENAE